MYDIHMDALLGFITEVITNFSGNSQKRFQISQNITT